MSKYLCAQPWKRSREVTFLIWVIDQYWSECRVIILWHSLCSLTTTWDFSSCCYSNLTVIWEHKEVLMTPALRFHVDWPLKVYFETGSEQVKKKKSLLGALKSLLTDSNLVFCSLNSFVLPSPAHLTPHMKLKPDLRQGFSFCGTHLPLRHRPMGPTVKTHTGVDLCVRAAPGWRPARVSERHAGGWLYKLEECKLFQTFNTKTQ